MFPVLLLNLDIIVSVVSFLISFRDFCGSSLVFSLVLGSLHIHIYSPLNPLIYSFFIYMCAHDLVLIECSQDPVS